MSVAFNIEQARELVFRVGLKPKFDTYLGSQKKHLVECPTCGKDFELLFSTINRRLKEDPNYKMQCQRCNDNNRSSKYEAEDILALFINHQATPRFTKEFITNKQKELLHKEFRRIHLPFLCVCGKEDWTILDCLITKINQDPGYALRCQSCSVKNGKHHFQRADSLRILISNYFSKYNLKVDNLEEISKHSDKLIFHCECGNIHKTSWDSISISKNKPMCLECQIKNKPRGENHPSWNPNLTEEERNESRNGRGNNVKIWSEILRMVYEFKCQIQNKVCRDLNVHHVKPWRFYPENQLDLSNGIVLSTEVHEEFHKRYGKHTDLTKEFYVFFKEKTGRDLQMPSSVVPLLIQDDSMDLLNAKKSFAMRGIELIPIFIEEATIKTNIIASMVKSRFGLITNKLHARDLTVKEIYDTRKVELFLMGNHRQGNIPAIINIGLVDSTGEIVSVMSFGKPRFNTEYQYELLRFCSKLNTVIHGAAQKIFNFFLETFKPSSIISYADLRYSSLDPTKTVYHNLGFKHSHFSTPNYWYTKDFITLEPRQKYQKHKLSALLDQFNADLSEEQNMKENGFKKLQDCGNHVFVWSKQ